MSIIEDASTQGQSDDMNVRICTTRMQDNAHKIYKWQFCNPFNTPPLLQYGEKKQVSVFVVLKLYRHSVAILPPK